MNETRDGYILLLTLMITTMAVILVSQFFEMGTVQVYFDRAMLDREKAKMVAYGALRLAQSKLIVPEEKKEEDQKDDKEKAKAEDPSKKFLLQILPFINRWQTITLDEKVDGMQAEIKLCISCEDGKIDLNYWWQQEKDKKQKKEASDAAQKNAPPVQPTTKEETPFLQTFFAGIKSAVNDIDLTEPCISFLKNRAYKLNDVTELLTDKNFQKAFGDRIFYEPPHKDETGKRPVYLTDLFTVFTGAGTLEPWLLSDSVSAALGFTRALAGDTAKRAKDAEQWLKEYKKTVALQNDWDKYYKPLYGKEYKNIAKNVQGIFNTTFDPKFFSILIHAKVGTITQKLYAIGHRTAYSGENTMIIKRLYWL